MSRATESCAMRLLRSVVSEKAGVVVEFVIVFPLILIIFIGIFELGLTLSNVSWANQVSYVTTQLGGDVNPEIGNIKMPARLEELHNLHGDYIENHSADYQYNVDDKTVTVEYEGDVQTILGKLALPQFGFGGLDLSINVAYTGPYTLKSLESPDSGYDDFADHTTGCYYDCNGDPLLPCGTKVSGPCNADQTPPSGGGTGGSSGGCFTAGTPVTLTNGVQAPIESVKLGDSVLAFNEKTKENVSAKVVDLLTKKRDGYYLLNGYLEATDEHPFYIDGEWVETKDLKVGTEFTSLTGEKVKLTSKEYVKKDVTVYNITVDEVHTFYAGGIRVHNKSEAQAYAQICIYPWGCGCIPYCE